MKRSVYIETTIASFYHEVRSEPEMIARRESARRWWKEDRPAYELYSSAFVFGELREGDFPGQREALAMIESLAWLEVVPAVEEIVAVYMRRKLMPLGDAYHLAVASYYGMHFLLTWNCRHLANANKVRHLQIVNGELGLAAPIITTPDLLLMETKDD